MKGTSERFCVRYKAPGDTDPGKQIGQIFQTAPGVQMYATWLNREGPLDWKVNGPGFPV